MSEETTKIAGEYIVEPNLKEVSDSLSEQSIDITNIVKDIDTEVFLKKFQEATEQELTNLLVNLKNSEDKKNCSGNFSENDCSLPENVFRKDRKRKSFNSENSK